METLNFTRKYNFEFGQNATVLTNLISEISKLVVLFIYLFIYLFIFFFSIFLTSNSSVNPRYMCKIDNLSRLLLTEFASNL